jgi:hypothetical protein
MTWVQLMFQRVDEGPETAHDYNARDRLDTAATYTAASQLQGFGREHAPVSMLYGYRPIIFSGRGEWQERCPVAARVASQFAYKFIFKPITNIFMDRHGVVGLDTETQMAL